MSVTRQNRHKTVYPCFLRQFTVENQLKAQQLKERHRFLGGTPHFGPTVQDSKTFYWDINCPSYIKLQQELHHGTAADNSKVGAARNGCGYECHIQYHQYSVPVYDTDTPLLAHLVRCVPSPRQSSIDETNDCVMKSERGTLVRVSDPP